MKVSKLVGGLLILVTAMTQAQSSDVPLIRDPFVPGLQTLKQERSNQDALKPTEPPHWPSMKKKKLNEVETHPERLLRCPSGWRYIGHMVVYHQLRALLKHQQHVSQFFQGQQLAGTAWKIHIIGSDQLILTNFKRNSHCVLKR
ncbi:hypothetical protein [Celerinatantimonas diazotrophica]|uniref:hypothetical protein n=1 Tax=Celerinatantimonas diazotrophica TaxID=412034 RepID=UPI001404DC0C|nr:hypothetical protein [Celerinatantimonas diazotrophica]